MTTLPSNEDAVANARVLLVTGMSGAGKSSALKMLEDLGFEIVDNIPLSLLPNLIIPGQMQLPNGPAPRPLAIAVDFRTRDFGADAFLHQVEALKDLSGVEPEILFIDCDDAELERRYKETRHRHPLAADRPVADGIVRERHLLMPLRDRAKNVVNTTTSTVADFNRKMRVRFGADAPQNLTIFVSSFGFRNGLPRDADLVFDVRFLANPYYDPNLRGLTGKDPGVAAYVAADEGFDDFFARLCGLIEPLLPRYRAEGKSYLTIGIGCTGGHHRSVYVAERLGARLDEAGWRVDLRHRDLAIGP